MKTLLKILAVILVLIACVPFIPPIYKNYTKGSSDNVRGKHYPNISTKHDRFPEKMFTFAV